MSEPTLDFDDASFHRAYDEVVVGRRFLEEEGYYANFRDRYLRTSRYIAEALRHVEPPPEVLDIGSGQFALLANKLFAAKAVVGDIDTRYTDALSEQGIGFVQFDLSREGPPGDAQYDLVVLAEVIEHVPRPPHLVFVELARVLRPGGRLLLTTPNLYRLRNVIRLALGRPVFDLFREPARDRPLGHFLEYSKDQLSWHLEEAGLQIERGEIVQLSWGGASTSARLGRRLLRPALAARPLWRDSLVFVARKPPST